MVEEKSLNNVEIDERHIMLKCVADNKTQMLERAVLEGWKQCSVCKYTICNICLNIFLSESEASLCPGSYLRMSHFLKVEHIPTELILVEAKKMKTQLPPIGLLINRAFFINNDSEPDLANEIIARNYSENESIFLAKQEQWANMGSVIVKRNRGKYISWERLSNKIL